MKTINGDVVILDQNDTQLARGESLNDTIKSKQIRRYNYVSRFRRKNFTKYQSLQMYL